MTIWDPNTESYNRVIHHARTFQCYQLLRKNISPITCQTSCLVSKTRRHILQLTDDI